MNSNPRVMQFMPGSLSSEESDALVDRIQNHFELHSFGLWAAEYIATGSFVGFIGLSITGFEARFTPCVEIGWRLDERYWGRGLATEGARQVLRHAFEVIGLETLVSFTVPANTRSRHVMEKLGMTHDPRDDFDHPRLPPGHALRQHVLYRLTRADWERAFAGQQVRPRG